MFLGSLVLQTGRARACPCEGRGCLKIKDNDKDAVRDLMDFDPARRSGSTFGHNTPTDRPGAYRQVFVRLVWDDFLYVVRSTTTRRRELH